MVWGRESGECRGNWSEDRFELLNKLVSYNLRVTARLAIYFKMDCRGMRNCAASDKVEQVSGA